MPLPSRSAKTATPARPCSPESRTPLPLSSAITVPVTDAGRQLPKSLPVGSVERAAVERNSTIGGGSGGEFFGRSTLYAQPLGNEHVKPPGTSSRIVVFPSSTRSEELARPPLVALGSPSSRLPFPFRSA